MVERIIKINGVEVVERLMTVDFEMQHTLQEYPVCKTEITHTGAYKLIDTATSLKTEDLPEGAFVVAVHGGVEVTIYKRENATRA